MTKDHIVREARKLISILSTIGNCLVPSIEGKYATALERLQWIVGKANEEYGMSAADIQTEIDILNKLEDA